MDSKRGPKLGDAASLWNFTPSPGWTKEESLILKLCLMKFGIGQWVQIQATGLLPGKLIQQLNGATQRLVGQQSLAAFSGLRVDIDRIRADNAAKTDAKRKSGLIIWEGANPTKEMRLQWQQEARDRYGLTAEQQQEAEAAYEQVVAARSAAATSQQQQQHQQPLPVDCNIMECDVTSLSTYQKQQLVCRLHKQLQQVLTEAVQKVPQLMPLFTYQQQQPRGWIALGMPLQQQAVQAADNTGTSANLAVRQAGTAAGLSTKAAAAAGSSSSGGGNSTGAGSKAGRGSCSSKAGAAVGGKSGRPPTGKNSSIAGKKRGRKPAAADDGDADADDGDFMQQQRQPKGGRARRASSSSGGGSGSAVVGDSLMLADLMQVALDAGVAQLVEMGYSRSKALDALKECACDVELAVEYLTAACC